MGRSLSERLAALHQSVGRQEPRPGGEASGREKPELEMEPLKSERHPHSGMTVSAEADAHPLLELGFQPVLPAGVKWDGTPCAWLRELRYDLLTRHGQGRFSDLLHVPLDALFRAGRVQPATVEALRFYDTETTGLGTGAGTIPFLHTVGRVDGDELVLRQYFLEDYGSEPQLLQALWQNEFTDGTVMVTFNGKSFDWTLLKNRMAMYRQAVPDIPQLDLLHPSRRLWKSQLERITLRTVEESVLGLVRTDDVPGREAPDRYFAYFDTRDVQGLVPVFDHNGTDVCSLIPLTAMLAGVLAGTVPVTSAQVQTAVGRYYDEWQEYDLAAACFVSALNCPDADWRSYWLYSMHLKRRRRWEEAAEIWEKLVHLYSWTVPPAVELAKYAEHRLRDYDMARRWTECALERSLLALRAGLFDGNGRSAASEEQGATHHPVVMALRHRLQRVMRKAERRQTRDA
ncbi:hypothetical protein GCM10025857_15930 [Alicyclobacillus contaminans]|uniref:ribonuclease H-like domain-containing protein n=1 Tax=Alicyclobacillus contaminans TaxID=392016 RepID=UPI00047ECF96|nr:ribonuclease H-like domain-containing protein [Alicyclobacillus contaminans]GMA50236.1 hypothetical protein GCM10025857_15930 [Alicyclobacillus contaminans]